MVVELPDELLVLLDQLCEQEILGDLGDRPLRLKIKKKTIQHQNVKLAAFSVSDAHGDTGAADPPAGTGEGAGVVQGLLPPLHLLSQGQDAQ